MAEQDLAERVVRLEVELAFQDKAIADLDEVIRAVRDELDALRRTVSDLAAEVEVLAGPEPAAAKGEATAPEPDPNDDVPPHY